MNSMAFLQMIFFLFSFRIDNREKGISFNNLTFCLVPKQKLLNRSCLILTHEEFEHSVKMNLILDLGILNESHH